MPRLVRAAAYELGLPIDSPSLHDAKSALGDLQAALQTEDAPRIAATARSVESSLAALDPAERAEVRERAGRLLDQAKAAAGATRGSTEVPGGGSGASSPGSASDAGSDSPPSTDTETTTPVPGNGTAPTTGPTNPDTSGTSPGAAPTDPGTADSEPGNEQVNQAVDVPVTDPSNNEPS